MSQKSHNSSFQADVDCNCNFSKYCSFVNNPFPLINPPLNNTPLMLSLSFTSNKPFPLIIRRQKSFLFKNSPGDFQRKYGRLKSNKDIRPKICYLSYILVYHQILAPSKSISMVSVSASLLPAWASLL